jgi:hypothetical protein
MSEALIPQEVIENKIYLIRGQKVMLDIDLAELYEVKTKQLNRQVRKILKDSLSILCSSSPKMNWKT